MAKKVEKVVKEIKKELSANELKAQRLKALMKIKNQINDKKGKELVKIATEVVNNKVKTNLPFLDYLTDGGLPRGAFSQIWSKKGGGKSSLCYAIIANVQKDNGICVYLDFEHTYDKKYAESFGINAEELFFAQPSSLEEGLNILSSVGNNADLIIIDSIVALGTASENEKDLDEAAKVASRALKITQFFEKQTGMLDSENGPAIVLINQTRTSINMSNPYLSGNDKYPGGNSLEHSLSLSLHLKRLSAKDSPTAKINGKNVPIGIRIECKVDKTKLKGNEGESIAYNLLKKAPHMDPLDDVISLGENKGLYTKRGAWMDYAGLSFNGLKAFSDEVRNNKDLADALTKHVMEGIEPKPFKAQEQSKESDNFEVEVEEVDDIG